MTCDQCGSHCQGALCADCQLERHLEEYHGVPNDYQAPMERDTNE